MQEAQAKKAAAEKEEAKKEDKEEEKKKKSKSEIEFSDVKKEPTVSIRRSKMPPPR